MFFPILISLLGQTCSGKSEMAVEIANWLISNHFDNQEFTKENFLQNIWIINCDSRQVYRDLNIGTGKVEGVWQSVDSANSFNQPIFFYKNLPHFLLDYIPPAQNYTLANFVQDYIKLFDSRQILPKYVILTGGTGLYAKAVTHEYDLGLIKPEFERELDELKKTLQNYSKQSLQTWLHNHFYFQGFKQMNESDLQNPRRLISKILKLTAAKNNWVQTINYPQFSQKINLAIEVDKQVLEQKIRERLQQRLDLGLLEEVKNLQYLGEDRLWDLGLEYRQTSLFLQQKISEEEWRASLFTENKNYAKRQLTWLKKQDLIWIKNLTEAKNVLSEKLDLG